MKICFFVQIFSYLIDDNSKFHSFFVNVILPLMCIIQLCSPVANNQDNHRDGIEMRMISADIGENGENNTSHNNQDIDTSVNNAVENDGSGDISNNYSSEN